MKKFFLNYLTVLLLVMVICAGCATKNQEILPRITFRETGPIRLADMKQADLEKLHTVFQKTASYDMVQWTNEQTGIIYNIMPRPVIKSGDMVCRTVVMETAGKKVEAKFELTACRQDDLWQVQSTH